MKHLLTLVCILGALISSAQTETLFSKTDVRWGGFGGPIVELSYINDDPVVDVGGGGGVIISDFFIGGYGMGSDAGTLQIEENSYDLTFGHGGLWLGYSYKPNKLIHPYVSLRFGGGELEAERLDGQRFSESFIAFSPDIGLELNLATWFKVVASAGYRITNYGGDGIPGIDDSDVDSFTAGLTFRFGAYNESDTDD